MYEQQLRARCTDHHVLWAKPTEPYAAITGSVVGRRQWLCTLCSWSPGWSSLPEVEHFSWVMRRSGHSVVEPD